MKTGFNGVIIPEGSSSEVIEKCLLGVTREMNDKVFKVNREVFMRNLDAVRQLMDDLLTTIRGKSEIPFNPASTAECATYFLDRLGLPIIKTSDSGAPSMASEVLRAYARMGIDVAGDAADYRSVRAVHSQLEAWRQFAEQGKVRIHWNQLGQPHGRYTSQGPCLNSRVREVLETIESENGFKFISADLVSAEYTTWAFLSGDRDLISAVSNEFSTVHEETGRVLEQMDPKWVPAIAPTFTVLGKTINFAILYLMQDATLAKTLAIPVVEAQKLKQAVQGRYKVALAYIQEILDSAGKEGCVRTVFGRTMNCSNLSSLRGRDRHQLNKTVWHFHNAGSAAELLKYFAARLAKEISSSGLQAKFVVNMYDEVILEVPDEEVEITKTLLREVMTLPIRPKGLPRAIKFGVDVRVGNNLLEVRK